MNLSNFYEDYAFNPDDFELLEGMYRGVVQAIIDYIYPLQDNRIARYIEDYRIVPIQYVDISEATYSLENILTSEQLKNWDSMSMENKVQLLKESGKYIQFTADRKIFFGTDEIQEPYEESSTKIINFDLWETDEKGYKLAYGLDYYYANNQLFLFGRFATPNPQNNMLKMTDIAVDFDTVNDLLGENLKLKYLPDEIPKIEFNDFVRELTLSALHGFVLDGMETAINNIPIIQGIVEIFDKCVDDVERAAMWKDGTLGLGPFDFVVYFPADLDQYRISLICQFLDVVRYASSNFHPISYDNLREEYNARLTSDELYDEITYDKDSVDIYGDFDDSNFYLGSDSTTNTANSRWGYADIAEDIPHDNLGDDLNDELGDESLDIEEGTKPYADSDITSFETYRPTDKQLFLGRRVMPDDSQESGFNEIDASLLNDANSRLAYASDEDKETP